jgi:DNA-binding transcriptional ArsR family regulator
MNYKNNQTHPKSADLADGEDQETPNPSHGYNAVLREGFSASDKISSVTATDEDYTLRTSLKKVIYSNEIITSQKMILTVIILKSKEDGYCELTYDEIAAYTALSRRNVATHIPLLERAGWVEKAKKSKTYRYKFLK